MTSMSGEWLFVAVDNLFSFIVCDLLKVQVFISVDDALVMHYLLFLVRKRGNR